MLDPETVAALVGGFVAVVVVAGWALFRWLATGRDPKYLDDPSILAAGPPPGMTAATATVITGGAHRLALFAGLLDLASRDEIEFRDEGFGGAAADAVGVEIHGGPTNDPRVLLNRRRPIGEAEAWLLTFLRQYALENMTGMTDDLRTADGMDAMLHFLAFTPAMADGGSGASAPGGMLSGTPDVAQLIAAAEARIGHPLPDQARASMERLAPLLETMRDPVAVAADPEGWADTVAAAAGQRPTARQIAMVQQWAQYQPGVVPPPAAGAAEGTSPAYITAARAAGFATPMGFGTYLETYARRHGWIAGLSIVARLKWRALSVVEIVTGLIVAALGGSETGLLTGIGIGVAGGGLATWLIAPPMASRTQAGAMVAAQLAAYRRTLQATFVSAASLDDAITKAGMSWLETPDQAVVWGVALGLQSDVAALLDRAGAGAGAQPASTASRPLLLAWWRGAPGPMTPAAAMFAGIERIGSPAKGIGDMLYTPVSADTR
jgi:hypothetical protein